VEEDTQMRTRNLAVPILSAVLVLAGCSSGSSPSPSTAPSAPGSQAPGSQAPASLNPAELGPIRVGVEAPGGEAYIPTQLTVKRLQEQGYDIEIVQFEDPDVMPQALDAGEIHINTNSAGQILSAVDAGLAVKAIQGLTHPDFVMVAKAEFPTCESLDGQRVAQQGTTGFGFASVTNWLARECPDAQPQMLDIPGSENRAVALLQGQIEATSLHLLRALQLQQEKPGEFTIIESFTFPENVTSAWTYALDSWIEANPALYEAYVTTFEDVTQEIRDDPQPAVDEGVATIQDAPEALIEQVMLEFAEQGWWTGSDGLSQEVFDTTLEFYEEFTDYDQELTYDMVILPPPVG
jgi:NitT/TauT family transport system substrate-binding protein